MDIIGTYNGIEIKFGNELVNLTNMWKACKTQRYFRPVSWLALEETKKFLESLRKTIKVGEDDLLRIVKGRNGGTYGHYQIALAYAKYLSPEFHIWCNEVIRQHFEFEANPESAVDLYTERLIEQYKKMGKSDAWIRDRLDGKIQHKLMMETLKTHGVNQGWCYGAVLGEVNKTVIGMTAKEFKEKRGVAKTRDGMNSVQLNAAALAQSIHLGEPCGEVMVSCRNQLK